MAKARITLEVDQNELFDRIAAMKGDMGPLGERIVGALLADTGVLDAIGMAFYGVTIVSREEVPEPHPPACECADCWQAMEGRA